MNEQVTIMSSMRKEKKTSACTHRAQFLFSTQTVQNLLPRGVITLLIIKMDLPIQINLINI